MATDTRERLLRTTAQLLRERGVASTGMLDVVAASGAPKGSLYFHFPGGKEQLVAEALQQTGADMCELMKMALDSSKSAKTGLANIFAFLSAELASSSFKVGCPMGTVAAEAPDLPQVRERLGEIVVMWHSVVKNRLIKAGAKPARADDLAELFLSIVEGAIVVAKARRSTRSLEVAQKEIARLLKNEGLT
ncbi:MAG: TetR/AcrR family transcriptional regulator [Polyangiaceae bacterium]